MKEYIDREKACAEIDKGDLLVGNNAEWAKEIIHRTPTADVVEVVRCKDCIHKGWVQEPCHGRSIAYCHIHEICIREDDFCSYGERKEKNNG